MNRNAFITYLPDEIVDDLITLREFKDKTNKEQVRVGYKPQYMTGDDDFIFSTPDAPINHNHYDNNKLAKIIKRLGDNFKHASAHGNRTLFTILARRFAEVPHETVEFQLSHNRCVIKRILLSTVIMVILMTGMLQELS